MCSVHSGANAFFFVTYALLSFAKLKSTYKWFWRFLTLSKKKECIHIWSAASVCLRISSVKSKKHKIPKKPRTHRCYSIDTFPQQHDVVLFISSFASISAFFLSEIDKSLQMQDKRSFQQFKLKNHHDCCSLHLLISIVLVSVYLITLFASHFRRKLRKEQRKRTFYESQKCI